jgi:hypothetical protein
MRPVNAITKQPLTSMEAVSIMTAACDHQVSFFQDEDLKWVEQNLPTTAIDK